MAKQTVGAETVARQCWFLVSRGALEVTMQPFDTDLGRSATPNHSERLWIGGTDLRDIIP